MGCIAFACNSGGPLESVKDGVTGFLMEPKPELWCQKIAEILNGPQDKMTKMRDNARRRVEENFTFGVFSKQLDQVLKRMSGEAGPKKIQ